MKITDVEPIVLEEPRAVRPPQDGAEATGVRRCLLLKVSTDEATPVPTVTTLWPVAGWLEREVYDMYGVAFAGNPDLRRQRLPEEHQAADLCRGQYSGCPDR